MRRPAINVLAALAVLTALNACATEAAGHANADPLPFGDAIREVYRADIELAARDATSDFERNVLADHWITEAEYTEAVTRFVSCAEENLPSSAPGAPGQRLTATRDRFGLYSIQGPAVPDADLDAWSEAYDRASASCEPGTKAIIEPLFGDMRTNPRHVTSDQMIIDCFARHGMVNTSYTTDNLHADTAENVPGIDPTSFDPAKATGIDWNAPEVAACLVTPWD